MIDRLLDIARPVQIREHRIQVTQLLLFNADDVFDGLGGAHRADVTDDRTELKLSDQSRNLRESENVMHRNGQPWQQRSNSTRIQRGGRRIGLADRDGIQVFRENKGDGQQSLNGRVRGWGLIRGIRQQIVDHAPKRTVEAFQPFRPYLHLPRNLLRHRLIKQGHQPVEREDWRAQLVHRCLERP